MNVAIISYGTGNIASLFLALEKFNINYYLANSISDLVKSDAIIFPGVGHFNNAAKNLENSGLKKYIVKIIKEGIPTLGICLGFQLLTLSSEESNEFKGLGFLPFSTVRLRVENTILNKVPHLGWNKIYSCNKDSKLLKGIKKDRQIFYYANAYGISPNKKIDAVQANYKHEKEMLALIEFQNIYGVQFHPEKSRTQGLELLKNFLDI